MLRNLLITILFLNIRQPEPISIVLSLKLNNVSGGKEVIAALMDNRADPEGLLY